MPEKSKKLTESISPAKRSRKPFHPYNYYDRQLGSSEFSSHDRYHSHGVGIGGCLT